MEQLPDTRRIITGVRSDENAVIFEMVGECTELDPQTSVSYQQEGIEVVENVREGQTLYVDLLNCTFLDATGLASVMKIYEKSLQDGKDMKVAVTGSIKRLFDITKVSDLVGIVDAVPDISELEQ